MDRNKALIIAVGFIIIIASFFAFGNFNFLNTQAPNAEERNIDKSLSKKLEIGKPVDWVIGKFNSSFFSNTSNGNESITNLSALNGTPDESPASSSSVTQIRETSNSYRQNTATTSITGEYYKNFIEKVSQIGFSLQELNSIKMNEEGRVLTLEELIDLAKSGSSLSELAASFAAWHNLDEKVLVELSSASVDPKAIVIHADMVDWFKYHSQTAQKFSTEELGTSQINGLAFEFQQKAASHTLKFKQNLDNPITLDTGIKKITKMFSPKKVEALSCGATIPPPFYHFGGIVGYMQPCNFGFVGYIGPPCGGAILFTYNMMAANPYLWWKTPVISTQILGRSAITPGICPLGPCPGCATFPYESVGLYWGSSLSPSI